MAYALQPKMNERPIETPMRHKEKSRSHQIDKEADWKKYSVIAFAKRDLSEYTLCYVAKTLKFNETDPTAL